MATTPGDEAALQQLTVLAKGNVTLRLAAIPTAYSIALAGSFNDWQLLRTLFFKEGTAGVILYNCQPVSTSYKIIVDGTW